MLELTKVSQNEEEYSHLCIPEMCEPLMEICTPSIKCKPFFFKFLKSG